MNNPISVEDDSLSVALNVVKLMLPAQCQLAVIRYSDKSYIELIINMNPYGSIDARMDQPVKFWYNNKKPNEWNGLRWYGII